MNGEVVVGRSSDCQIVLEDDSVSKKHCKFRMDKGHLKIKDLGSTNGTFVNNGEVISEAEISSGSTLTLGTRKMKVELHS